jgi:hypothetical protein
MAAITSKRTAVRRVIPRKLIGVVILLEMLCSRSSASYQFLGNLLAQACIEHHAPALHHLRMPLDEQNRILQAGRDDGDGGALIMMRAATWY